MMKFQIGLACFLALACSVYAQESTPTTGNFVVSGKLYSSRGDVIRHAVVQLAPTTRRSDLHRFETGADGEFSFPNLPAGKYSLMAQAHGFPLQFFEQHGQYNTAIAVGTGKTSTGIVFRLQPEAAITGRVLDEHNEPLRQARVLLFERNNDSGYRAVHRRGQQMTDDRGVYAFRHLRPGLYYVVAAATPWYRQYLNASKEAHNDSNLDVAYPLTYYPNALDAESAGAIALHAGDDISADFNLAPVQALHVILQNAKDENGRPPQLNFRQMVFGEDAGIFLQSSMSVTEKQTEITGLAPGQYEMTLHRYVPGQQTQPSRQEVTLGGNTEIDANAVDSSAFLEGHLTYQGGTAPERGFIQFIGRGGRITGAPVDKDGSFHVQIPTAGRYTLALLNAPGFAIASIAGKSVNVSGRTIDYSPGNAAELSVTATTGVAEISGTVMKNDRSVSGTMVVLVPQGIQDNYTMFRRDQSDSDGTFILHDVAPGKYKLLAIQNGWDLEWATPEALGPYLAKATDVEVQGKSALDVKVTAQ